VRDTKSRNGRGRSERSIVKRHPLSSSTAHFGLWISVFGLLTLLLSGCGRKGPPLPPEDVVPRRIADLAASNVAGGIQLSWRRPELYSDGERMTDLGGFTVERAIGAALTYQKIATLEVTDRDRFRQIKRFTHVDSDVTPGVAYRYRVVSFTVDRYVSAPSNAVTIERTASNEGRNALLPTPQR
jgi:Prokaryotic lipoprotein-attachment site